MHLASQLSVRLLGIMAIALAATCARAQSPITIDTTSNPTFWLISNGALTVHFRTGDGRISSIQWNAFPGVELIDVTNQDHNGPKGFYMDNAGVGFGTVTPGYFLDPNGSYIDFWLTHAVDCTNPVTYTQHYILFANDPGIHIYLSLDHGPGDPPAGIGQIQWVLRGNLSQFTNTYDVNTGLGNLGARTVPANLSFGDGGRGVQDASVDLHGLSEPAGFRREFYTKYDYSTYEYLHHGHGVYGSTIAAWMVLPSQESLTGGPTKQDLIFTNNLLIMEAYSNHLNNQMSFPIAQDAVVHRLYGPFYLHYNGFDGTHPTAASLFAEAQCASEMREAAYDGETQLLDAGYVPSTQRGEVNLHVVGAKHLGPLVAWAVLSDQNTNFQYSHAGPEYWANVHHGGIATFHKVVPGTYRLSVYVLGQWGELRLDGVQVGEHSRTHLRVNFAPEAFSSAEPIWTIGVPDRSSHEFLHGTVTNPADLDPNYSDRYTSELGNSVRDDREFWGNWNYWADFAANSGAVIYYATSVGSTPATNDLTAWNYNQWHIFHPGLYAGIYNPADQTTDGYNYICPSYVGPFGACATAAVPDWEVHFTTNSAQQAQGQYVVLSIGLAATEANLTASLNGAPLRWTGIHLADADVRSGFSGTYQWVVFQFPTSLLTDPDGDNVITFHVDKTQGVMYDALRMEISNTSADHESTGWNDYEFVSNGTYEPADDAVNNQKAAERRN
jgi:hypothetical protein